MKTLPFNPEVAGSENLQVFEGPVALDHEHSLMQRGSQHDWSEENNAYIVSAIMHCTDQNCGYAELQEWDDTKHSENLSHKARVVEPNLSPWTMPIEVVMSQ